MTGTGSRRLYALCEATSGMVLGRVFAYFFARWSCANLKLLFCNDRVGVKRLHVNTGIRTDLPSFLNLSRKTVLLSYF